MSMTPTVFREGWDAAINGKLRAANPYADVDLARAAAWLQGFEDAKCERSKDVAALGRQDALTHGQEGPHA